MKNLITIESALYDDEWEMIPNNMKIGYAKFREVGMKKKRTLTLHIHDLHTGVFIDNVFIRLVNNWEELHILKEAMFGDLDSSLYCNVQ
jgi:hypothetical protein